MRDRMLSLRLNGGGRERDGKEAGGLPETEGEEGGGRGEEFSGYGGRTEGCCWLLDNSYPSRYHIPYHQCSPSSLALVSKV